MPAISDIVTTNRASTGTYFDAAGVMQTAPNNVWRMDHDPVTGAPLGVLIEEQRTNILLQSENLEDAGWIKIQSTVTEEADNRGMKMFRFTPNTSLLTQHAFVRVSGFPSLATDTAFAIGIVAKAGPGDANRIALLLSDGVGIRTQVYVDLLAGAIVSGAEDPAIVPYSRVAPLGDGFFRVEIVYIVRATSTQAPIYVLSASPVGAPLGVSDHNFNGTDGYLVSSPQIEQGAFPTSYIPTTDAAATRAAERGVIGSINPWFSNSSGSMVIDYTDAVPVGTQYGYIAGFNQNDSTATYIGSAVGGPSSREGFRSSTDGVVHFNRPYSLGRKKMALAWDASGSTSVRNGGAPVSGAAINNLGLLSQFVIGNLRLSSTDLRIGQVHIRSITYYPRRLSNAELQRVTS